MESRRADVFRIILAGSVFRWMAFAVASPWILSVARGDPTLLHYVLYLSLLAGLLGALGWIVALVGLVLDRYRSRAGWTAVVVLEALVSLALCTDVYFYVRYGFHLDNPIVLRAFQLNDTNFGFQIDGRAIGIFLIALASSLSLHSALAWFFSRRVRLRELRWSWREGLRWGFLPGAT